MAEPSVQDMDESFSVPSVMEFRERRRRTYYVRADEELDGQDFVLSFVLEVKAELKVDGDPGLLCMLQSKDHPDRLSEVFIRNSSWGKRSAFTWDLTHGMNVPPTIISADNKLLQKYMDWKYTSYIRSCNEKNVPCLKTEVKWLGVQGDLSTWCFGPQLFYVTDKTSLRLVDSSSCSYAWTPESGRTLRANIKMDSTGEECELLRLLKGCLPPGTFNAYLLMMGHSWLSVMYTSLIKTFHQIPALCIFGHPNTEKSWLADLSVCFYGDPMEELCSYKKITESALHTRQSLLRFPLVIHDLGDIGLMCQIIEAVSENKSYVNSKTGLLGVKPSSAVLFTMNHDALDKFLKRAEQRSVTRAIFAEMTEQIEELNGAARKSADLAKIRASQFLPALLFVSENFLMELERSVHVTVEKFEKILVEEGVAEGSNRVAKNYALLAHATLTVLDRLNDNESNRAAFLNYTEQVTRKSVARYKSHRTTTALGSELTDRAASVVLDMVNAVAAIQRECASVAVASFIRHDYVTQEGEAFVAVLKTRPSEVDRCAAGKALTESVVILQNTGATGKPKKVRFGNYVQNHAILIPKGLLTTEDYARLRLMVQPNYTPAESVQEDTVLAAPTVPFVPLLASTPVKDKNHPVAKRNFRPIDEHSNHGTSGEDSPRVSERDISPIEERSSQNISALLNGNPREAVDGMRDRAQNSATVQGFVPDILSTDKPNDTLLAVARLQRSQASSTSLLQGAVCIMCHKDLPDSQKMIDWLPCADCGRQYHRKCGHAPAKISTRSRKTKPEDWKCGFCTAKVAS